MEASRVPHYLLCALFWLLLLASTAGAQSAPSAALPDQQLWEFGVWGAEAVGAEIGQEFGDTQITMAGIHVGRVIHRRTAEGVAGQTLEYTVELSPLFLVTNVRKAYGGGFAPVGLKWNFVSRGRYHPYLEVNGGAMFTQKDVPPVNTSAFNFTAAFGPGVMMRMRRNQALSLALRYFHMSNGGLGYNNPSFNTVQFVVGYHWLAFGHGSRQQLSNAGAGTQAKE